MLLIAFCILELLRTGQQSRVVGIPLLLFLIFLITVTDWVAPRVFKTRARRFRKHVEAVELEVCVECGYDLVGLPDHHRCPECGIGYDKHEVRTIWQAWFEA